jgi:NADH-quinone oxidoreductase subunit L
LVSLEHLLEPVFAGPTHVVKMYEGGEDFFYVGLGLAVCAFVAGVAVAQYFYVQQKGKPAAELQARFPAVHSFLSDKWRIDEFYEETILGAVDSLADICVWADRWIVDGILARFTAFLVSVAGSILRFFQTGRVQTYGAMTALGMVLVGCYVVAPSDNVRTVFDHAGGNYSIEAAPGFGYSYRWDADGDEKGEWDSKDFGTTTKVAFKLDPEKTRVVRLEVKNAFGQVNQEKFEVTRPLPDLSGGPVTYIDVAAARSQRAEARQAQQQAREKKLPPDHPGNMKPVEPGAVSPEQQQLKKALREGEQAQ